MSTGWAFALVLGGGGMKGLAHVGALRALEEHGWAPSCIVGTSIGSLLGSAWAVGFTLQELEAMALSLRRRDVFVLAGGEMAMKRMRARSLYRPEPLDTMIRGLLGEVTFRDLPKRLIANCVDINSGMQVYWGLPGLDGAKVADAVFASCALPGFFPPREIEGRFYVDGAVVDNLPVRVTTVLDVDAVVAVDVGAASVLRADLQEGGFASVYLRGSEIVFQQSMELHLRGWARPPMLLVQPRVEHVPIFSFDHARELVDEGYRATAAAIEQAGDVLRGAESGVYPRRRVEIRVVRERCIGCGACVSHAPALFRMDQTGKAVGPTGPCEWSPIDGGVIRHCPTYAITAHPVGRAAGAATGGASTGTAQATA